MASNHDKAKRHVVLVVDDHEPTRALVARILEQELDVQIVLAGTCEQALRHAEQRRFDMINRLWVDRRTFVTLVTAAGRLPGELLVRAMPLLRWGWRGLRQAPRTGRPAPA